MTTTAASKPRTARQTAAKARPLAVVTERQAPQEPTPAAKPEIKVEVVPVPYHRPTVTFPDGKTVMCRHPYLHESEKAAAACGRKIADRGEFVK